MRTKQARGACELPSKGTITWTGSLLCCSLPSFWSVASLVLGSALLGAAQLRGLVASAVLAVPLTFGLYGSWRYAKSGWQFWQPFRGGRLFVSLQAVCWFCWAFSLWPWVMPSFSTGGGGLVMTGGGVMTRVGFLLPWLPRPALLFSALTATLAQLACTASLFHFAGGDTPPWPSKLAMSLELSKVPRGARALGSAVGRRPGLWGGLIAGNLILATGCCSIAAGVDLDGHFRAVQNLPPAQLALAALVCAALMALRAVLIHGVGGTLRYRHLAWAFWQPFAGGVQFVVIQALAWALFGTALAAFGVVFLGASFLTGWVPQGLLASAGLSGLASEVLLAVSLLTYIAPSSEGGKTPPRARAVRSHPSKARPRVAVPKVAKSGGGCHTVSSPPGTKGGGHAFAQTWNVPPHVVVGAATPPASPLEQVWRIGRAENVRLGLLFIFYAPHFFFIASFTVPFIIYPPLKGALVVLAIYLLYWPTWWGRPALSGRRKWNSLRFLAGRLLAEATWHHWGGLRIVREAKAPLLSTERYVFGYHPHGLFPVTAAWFHLTPGWKTLFPNIHPCTLAASAIFCVPVLRDLMLWAGGRQVCRRGFQNGLEEDRAVVLCPGGQSELVLQRPVKERVIVLCARKKGFVRLAMEAGAQLVPVFAFGEAFNLWNIVDWPRLQLWTYKRLGFPIPFVPLGYYGTPLPERNPVALVVGEPIPTRKSGTTEAFSEEEVDALQKRYYEAVRNLFERHKAEHGYGDFRLVLKEG